MTSLEEGLVRSEFEIKVGNENRIIYRLWVLVTVVFRADGSISNLYEIVLPAGYNFHWSTKG